LKPTTIISFVIKQKAKTSLRVYDIFGKLVGEIVNDQLDAGKYSYEFNGSNLSSVLNQKANDRASFLYIKVLTTQQARFITKNSKFKTHNSKLITYHSSFIRKFVSKIKEKYVRRKEKITGRIRPPTRRFTRLSLTLKRRKKELKN